MSVLRYPGGKTRACKILEKTLKDNFDIPDKLYSPFFGGGSFEFYMRNNHNTEIIANDKFYPLINFWKIAQDNNKRLVKRVRKLKPLSKRRFNQIKEKIDTTENDIRRASYFFAINRSSFSGSTLSGGFSKQAENKRFNESSIKRLENIDLKNIQFSDLDFTDFLNDVGNDEFIFLDPPYYLEKKSKLYGKKGNLHNNFDHESLCNMLKNKNKWLLCYNNCEYIRDLYKDYTILEVKWSYGMNKDKKSSEIVIINN